MSTKAKRNLGITIAALCICVLLAFSFFIFPSVLATVPDNREVETITPDATYPTVEQPNDPGGLDVQEGSDDSYSIPDGAPDINPDININAISKEQAIEQAIEMNKPDDFGGIAEPQEFRGKIQHVYTSVIGARYIESSDPASDPSWFVLFAQILHDVAFRHIPDGISAEKYLDSLKGDNNVYFGFEIENAILQLVTDWDMVEIGTDPNGIPSLIYTLITPNHFVWEINALTSEPIDRGGLLGAAGETLDLELLEQLFNDGFTGVRDEDFRGSPPLGPIDPNAVG